jgi:hypothetical protein
MIGASYILSVVGSCSLLIVFNKNNKINCTQMVTSNLSFQRNIFVDLKCFLIKLLPDINTT